LLVPGLFFKACEKKDRYIVATTPNYPPLVMITKEKEITGYDIDVMKRIASYGGMTIKIIPVLEGNLLYGLIDETYDIAIAAIVPPEDKYAPETPDISYSKPYLTVGDVLVVSEDARDFSGLEWLTNRRVGVPIPSPSKELLLEQDRVTVKEYRNVKDAFEELALGKIDAVCLDLLKAAQYVNLNEEYSRIFQIYPKPVTRKEYSIAVRGGNNLLLNKINSGIEKMQRDGTLTSLTDEWFFE
jgi:ABC-type amino acid transport substrate-binding protein